jgi:hypothetical protein
VKDFLAAGRLDRRRVQAFGDDVRERRIPRRRTRLRMTLAIATALDELRAHVGEWNGGLRVGFVPRWATCTRAITRWSNSRASMSIAWSRACS